MFFVVIIFLFVVSLGWAFVSLRGVEKGIPTEETVNDLKKERVIFHSSDVSDSEDSSN